ncbi:MAG: hypothetical protein HHJ10_14935 [Cellulomonas sp.]|uniref:hypothetical protein n=1 Tax=Cellulomonas sp. TaxID=40001 RepID=UPI0017B8992B|nr:hypothetical protein [Cellulomonas sp.]NMM32293.1 hypothetical protein [Cellulomonas sp.]
MTIDLARTLHDAVDGTGTTFLLGHGRPDQDAVAETVGHLATRIRTRRAVRAGTRAGVGAPILLTLLPQVPPLSGLPDAFPADVPIIGGRLLGASELDGTLASGWLVTVAVDGVDGVTRALDSLRGFAPRWQKISIPSSATDTVAATIGSWDVAAHAGLTDDGQSTVVYRLTPR